jgi:hypothetical protein
MGEQLEVAEAYLNYIWVNAKIIFFHIALPHSNIYGLMHRLNTINFTFKTLSIAYISGIFLFADSPMVSNIAPFNPFGILHIPLYGILTLLLILSISPFKFHHHMQKKQIGQTNHKIVSHSSYPLRSFLLIGLIAFGVAIADEIHQAYIPGRDASLTDVLLDLFGIILAFVLISRFHKHQPYSITQ